MNNLILWGSILEPQNYKVEEKKLGVENFDFKFRKASKYELKIDLKELKIKKILMISLY